MTSQHVSSHSSTVGGSSASRFLQCPGHYDLSKQVPKTSTGYADEGTALHDAMALILSGEVEDDAIIGREITVQREGGEPSTYVMSPALYGECLAPALDYFDALMERIEQEDGEEPKYLIEQSCVYPGIPDARGTSDVVIWTSKRVTILDWKFGAGVPVSSENNAQLKFYALAAIHSLAITKAPELVELIICQPRIGDPEPWVTDMADLRRQRDALVRAFAEATSDDPSFAEGPACRFCPATPICPLKSGKYTKALTGLLEMQQVAAPGVNRTGIPAVTAMLPVWLDILPDLEHFVKAVQQLAHEYLDQGGTIPGYKLVPKKAPARAWRDETAASRFLGRQGIPDRDRTEKSLLSPAKIEKVIDQYERDEVKGFDAAKTRKLLAGYIVQPPPSGNKLVPDSDARPGVPSRAERIGKFAELQARFAEAAE